MIFFIRQRDEHEGHVSVAMLPPAAKHIPENNWFRLLDFRQ
jgi:hypothetical protein